MNTKKFKNPRASVSVCELLFVKLCCLSAPFSSRFGLLLHSEATMKVPTAHGYQRPAHSGMKI
jgi:hypothetical protein